MPVICKSTRYSVVYIIVKQFNKVHDQLPVPLLGLIPIFECQTHNLFCPHECQTPMIPSYSNTFHYQKLLESNFNSSTSFLRQSLNPPPKKQFQCLHISDQCHNTKLKTNTSSFTLKTKGSTPTAYTSNNSSSLHTRSASSNSILEINLTS